MVGPVTPEPSCLETQGRDASHNRAARGDWLGPAAPRPRAVGRGMRGRNIYTPFATACAGPSWSGANGHGVVPLGPPALGLTWLPRLSLGVGGHRGSALGPHLPDH